MVKESNSLKNKKLHSSKPYDVSNSFVKKVTSRVTNLLPQPAWLSKWFTSASENVGQGRDALNLNDSGSDDEGRANVQVPPAKRAKIPVNQSFPPNSFQISPIVSSVQVSSGQQTRNIQNDYTFDASQAGPSGINTRQPQLLSSTPNMQSTSTNILTTIERKLTVQSGQPENTSRNIQSEYVSLDSSQAGPSGINTRQHQHISPSSSLLANAERKMNGDDRSESSESTSGCSSLVPQANRQFQGTESEINSLSTRRRSIDEKLNYTGHLQSPRSLFSERSHSRSPWLNSSLRRRRPSFNVSSFGSPAVEKEKSLVKNRIVNSPFYMGRTMYGGASAYRKPKDGFFISNEVASSKRCDVQIKPMNCGSDSLSSMSTTARRILEALEHFSTPVLDAKRIPMEPSVPPLSSKRKRPHDPDFGLDVRPGQIPRTPNSTRPQMSGLTIPTMPDLLKMRHKEEKVKLQDSIEAARLIAASSTINSLSSTSNSNTIPEYKLGIENCKKMKHGGKIRSKEKELEETTEKVNLPNISLPVTSLPKFDFIVPPANNITPVTSTFKFASPITVTKNVRTCVPADNFTFSKPLSALDSKDKSQSSQRNNCLDSFIPSPNKINDLQFTSGSDKVTLIKKDDSKNVLCKTDSQNSELCFGIKPAAELKAGSVMDFFSKDCDTKNKEDVKDNLLDKFKPAHGMWECGSCMIYNKSDEGVCAACKTPRTPVIPTSKTLSTNSDTSSKEVWECYTCNFHNSSNSSVCIKCSSEKGGKSLQLQEQKIPQEKSETSSSDFGNKFKPASDTWECSTCLIRNSDSLKECEACGTKKPVLSATPVMVTKAGFGNMFKKPKGTWDCPDCMLSNKEESVKCVACERAKPGSETQNTLKYGMTIPADVCGFNFGIDKAGTKVTDSNTSSSLSLQGFKFGETKVTGTTSFSFGVSTTVNNISKSDTVTPSFSFGKPLTSNIVKSTEESTSSQTRLASVKNEENKATPGGVLLKQLSSNKSEVKTTSEVSKLSDTGGIPSINKTSVTSTENINTSKTSEEKPEAKKVTFSFGSSSTAFTTEKPNISTKNLESVKPTFSFGIPTTTTTTSLNFNNAKPAVSTIFSFGTNSASFGSLTSSNATSLATTAAKTNTETSSNLGGVTTMSAPSCTSTASTASPSLFSFGSTKPSVSFGSSTGLSFGQTSASASTTSSFSTMDATAATTTTTSGFSFTPNTAQIKPFSLNKESTVIVSSKKAPVSFGSETSSAAGSTFAPKSATSNTTTVSTVTVVTSSTAPFGDVSTTSSFSSGEKGPISAFSSNTTTSSSPTSTTFGSTPKASFSSGFSSLAEKKQPDLPTANKSLGPAATFSFGGSNSSSSSLGQTAPFIFTGVQNDQVGKNSFTFGTTNNNSLGTANPTGNANPTGSAGFNFGTNNQTSVPTFSFGSTVATTTSTPTSTLFGAGSNLAAPIFGSANSSSPFAGNTPNTTTTSFTTPTFNFGSNSSQPSSGVFSFSSNQASGSTNVPVHNFATPTPTFNFSQTPSSTQATPPTFNFNVRPNFNFGKSETPPSFMTPATPNRPIKKAMRRSQQR